jgi:hypothetical protein
MKYLCEYNRCPSQCPNRESLNTSVQRYHRISLHGDTAIDYVDACIFSVFLTYVRAVALLWAYPPSKVVCGPHKWTAESTQSSGG